MYSYHIFYFPFKWKMPNQEKLPFSKQVELNQIRPLACGGWERCQLPQTDVDLREEWREEYEEIFAEKQYYFEFVHSVLYDIEGDRKNLIHHYERKEPKRRGVVYQIKCKNRIYELQVEAIDVNLYSTGVGVLSFFLRNERDDQKDESSIRDINQFGRRIMPPHAGEFAQNKRGIIAEELAILGLDGIGFRDTFCYGVKRRGTCSGLFDTWQPSLVIKELIEDLNSDLQIIPIADDRMYVNSFMINDKWSESIATDADTFIDSADWYKYLFVDDGADEMCQNQQMRKDLSRTSSYKRWTNYGVLYGVSRYSFVTVVKDDWFSKNVLAKHMRTIYSRMYELIIVQQASILRFSGEVTFVSGLREGDSGLMAQQISSLYKEYIRFINQVYFRSITSQDQGIELYRLMMKQFDCKEQVKELDGEINELHQYVSLLIEQKRSENGEMLNKIAIIFLPITVVSGIWGMSGMPDLCENYMAIYCVVGVVILTLLSYYLLFMRKE